MQEFLFFSSDGKAQVIVHEKQEFPFHTQPVSLN